MILQPFEIASVRSSFSAVARQAAAFVERFYERLFLDYPGIKPLFVNVNMKTQKGMLLTALKVVVENLEDTELLAGQLAALGKRHQGYGAEPAHFSAVAETLITTLWEFAGQSWNSATEEAWKKALNFVAEVMLGGYESNEEKNINAPGVAKISDANQLTVGARDDAKRGSSVVTEAVNAMREIEEASKQIADTVDVTDEIAFQTNLLALNAAVEAARDGEYGRGFAVVASKVRTLAQRSASAAKEIKTLIKESVAKFEQDSRLVDQSGSTPQEIVNAVKKINEIIDEIAVASQEQANGIEQINRAAIHTDRSTQENAALVEKAASASEAIDEQTKALNDLMAFFRISVVESPTSAANQDRRAADRPWTGSTQASAKKPAVTPQSRRAAVAGPTDDESWE
jgi:hemoglobin-like flavoprotein